MNIEIKQCSHPDERLDSFFPPKGWVRIIVQTPKLQHEMQLEKKVFEKMPNKQLVDFIRENYKTITKDDK